MVSLSLDNEWVPDPYSAEIMAYVDSLSKPMRDLVREYGLKIVSDMIAEDYTKPDELADLLETWRERRQEQWLDTTYITSETAKEIADRIQSKIGHETKDAYFFSSTAS